MSAAGTPEGAAPRPVSENALPVGTHVADFEITRVVGEGGFGIVYEAFDHSLHRKVALKEYMPSALAGRRDDYAVHVRSEQHGATFRAGLKSFVNEARLLAQFDHPALVKVFRFWEQNETAYMVMPLYEGRTLKDVLREHPQPDEAWLKAILAPLLDALEVMHAAKCYHRDVAADNILILDNGAPVLLDFGAARRIIGDMTQAVTVILKPGYAPVEQYADDAAMPQGPWTDVYALAAVCCLAITGKPPPAAVTRMVNDTRVPLARSVLGYGNAFLAALDRALAVLPADRPQSIAQFRDLLGVRSGPTTSTVPIDLRPSAAGRPAIALEATTKVPTVSPARRTLPPPAPPPPQADAAGPRPAARRPRWPLLVGGVAALALAGVLVTRMGGAPAPVSAPATVAGGSTAAATAPAVERVEPPKEIGAAPAKGGTPAVAAPVAVAGKGPAEAAPAVVADAPPPQAPPAAAKGRVVLAVKPWGGIYVNGQPQGVTPPKKFLELPEGRHTIEIRNTGFPSHTRDVDVRAGRSVTVTHTFQ